MCAVGGGAAGITVAPMVIRSLLVSATCLAGTHAAEPMAFFESKVRPLLLEHCIECHGGEKTKGGLRLTHRGGWETGGDSGPALVPGKPDESLLIKAVRYRDENLSMPPERKLTAAQIAVLEEWVRLGAPDPREEAAASAPPPPSALNVAEGRKFWAWQPVQKPPVPAVKDTAWPHNEVDRFVLAEMEARGLKPGPDAAPQALVRRLHFTLTGLPPEVSDKTDMSDLELRLLASPQFAERMAAHWLDVVRFAESSGGGRTLLFKDAWRYRDYVIQAFHEDRPLEQMIREQIAGDLLPAENAAQRERHLTATAFLALGPTNYEEQDKQQLRFDIIDEQLDTLGKVFMGQTIGCARCHDHKFDPIPQRDYYALAGIFASTRTLHNYTDNVARWIEAPLPADAETAAKLAAHESAVAALEKELAAAKQLLAKTGAGAGARIIGAATLPGIVVDDDEARAVGGWVHSTHVKGYVGRGYHTDRGAARNSATLSYTPRIAKAGRYEVRFSYTPGASRAAKVPVHILHASGEDTLVVDQTKEPPIEGRWISLGTYRFEKEGAGYIMVSNEGTTGHVTADAVWLLPEEPERSDKPARSDKSAADGQTRSVQDLEKRLSARKKDGPQRPVAMSVREDEKPAGTEIRVRGQVHQKGALVPRGVLTVAGAAPAFPDNQSGRLQLAEWLASPSHPLTARVYVNRVWCWLFGEGLVRSVDNFGVTGDRPTHPALLDWLAARFVEEGWSTKWLVREMVTARTWQLAAAAPSAADPDNLWLTHAHRRRLDAGQIRDAILAAAGTLDRQSGGPNIAGAGVIDANDTASQNVEYSYVFKDTRRSLYTPAFRNRRHELFEIFDFADINAPAGRRHTSTVAPQALFLMNHPFVHEQARQAAEKLLAEVPAVSPRLEEAFLSALGRKPSEGERAAMETALASAGSEADGWQQVFAALFGCADFRYLD